jgi:NAD(P)-dependent dehydrogenase (short-subunit alcohol dehydrogenase family)
MTTRTLAALSQMNDRVCLVTGGAGHLGRAFADTLTELGAHVVLVDRDAAALEAVVGSLPPGRASSITVDLLDETATAEVVPRALGRHGRLDVLVNNAAFTGASGVAGFAVPLPQQTMQAWNAAMRVNLGAAFQLSLSAREALTSARGVIVNVGSIYGAVGPDFSLYEGTQMGNPAAYGASKGGLIQLTRYLATALAPHVRVNALSPGGIARGQPESFREKYEARTPLRRMATEEDLKGALAYFASDLSAYVTGQHLLVDGGWTAW